MGAIDTRSFKSGNSVAVRFPRSLGLPADIPIKITRDGDGYRVTPQVDPNEGKRRIARLIAALNALPPVGAFQQREGIEFPDRDWS